MDMLNLSRDLKDRLPDELSGGQQQSCLLYTSKIKLKEN